MTPALSRLDHLAVIRVSGADRAALLQGQASNDAHKVDVSHAQLTSFSNPKGRCYAIAVLAAHGDSLLLVTEASIAPALAKRLAMYVLRSQAKVELAPALAVAGISGGEPWACVAEDDRIRVGLPGARSLVVMPAHEAATLREGSADWRRADIAAGIPTVLPETAEHFVPLWLGLERLGAIDFKKGCYTGQEIVARTQYRGILKKRMAVAHVEGATPTPGQSVYSPAFGDQSAGVVVNAAAAPEGGYDFLVVAQLESLRQGALRLGSPDGAPITIRSQPAAEAPR
jgi:folate-binding protein YgfZ